MRRWHGLVERYAQLSEARGLAATTVAARRRELERFGSWLRQRKPTPRIEEINGDLIVRYIRDRGAFKKHATVASVVSELRCMGEFLVEEGLWTRNPLRWIRGPKLGRQLPRRVGQDHLSRIWGAAQKKRQEHARYQAMCILAVLYGTGLRRGELERLDVDDWDRESGTLKIDGRKTGVPRLVPVGQGVWRCIEAYLPYRHNVLEQTGRLEEVAFLVNRNGGRLRAQDVSRVLAQLAKHADIPRVTLHQFRHSCASDLLASGVRLPEVQRILGHASIQSTVRYVEVAGPERAAAMKKHPINDFLGIEREDRHDAS